MEQQHALTKLQEAKKAGGDRKFTQSVDLVVNLKGLDMKKNDNHVDFYLSLPHSTGKKVKICGLVGPELADESKKVCDHTVVTTDFKKLKPKDVKKLAKEYAYFIAQANVMPQVASTFGRILGPRGKMPNPKAGCVVPPKAQLQPLYDKLQKTLNVQAKKAPIIHLKIGSQDQDEKEVAENISLAMSQITRNLPQERDNIKNAILKLTMGKTVML